MAVIANSSVVAVRPGSSSDQYPSALIKPCMNVFSESIPRCSDQLQNEETSNCGGRFALMFLEAGDICREKAAEIISVRTRCFRLRIRCYTSNFVFALAGVDLSARLIQELFSRNRFMTVSKVRLLTQACCTAEYDAVPACPACTTSAR